MHNTFLCLLECFYHFVFEHIVWISIGERIFAKATYPTDRCEHESQTAWLLNKCTFEKGLYIFPLYDTTHSSSCLKFWGTCRWHAVCRNVCWGHSLQTEGSFHHLSRTFTWSSSPALLSVVIVSLQLVYFSSISYQYPTMWLATWMCGPTLHKLGGEKNILCMRVS